MGTPNDEVGRAPHRPEAPLAPRGDAAQHVDPEQAGGGGGGGGGGAAATTGAGAGAGAGALEAPLELAVAVEPPLVLEAVGVPELADPAVAVGGVERRVATAGTGAPEIGLPFWST